MFLFAFRCPSRASGHRGRDGKRSSGKIHIHSRCCRGAFPESPSQGFGETYSSVASSATLRSSFPYVCRGNIFMATAIDGGSAETRTRDLQRWQGSSEGVSPRFQQHRSTPDRTAWCTRDGSVQQMGWLCPSSVFYYTDDSWGIRLPYDLLVPISVSDVYQIAVRAYLSPILITFFYRCFQGRDSLRHSVLSRI